MPGLTVPGSTPPRRPPARPPQTGSYQQTAGGSTYLPSPEEQAEAERQAALRRQAEDDAWTANDRRSAEERANQAYQDQNQRYANSRSDRREGIAALERLSAGGFGGGSGGGGGTGGGSGGGGSAGVGAYSPASDAATYTRAKENTGQALTSAQRGLDEAMNRRGIYGSGIHAGNLEELYAAGLGDLADVDLQMAQDTADRGFRSSEAAAGRNWESGERERDRAAGLATSRLQAILQLYGMVY